MLDEIIVATEVRPVHVHVPVVQLMRDASTCIDGAFDPSPNGFPQGPKPAVGMSVCDTNTMQLAQGIPIV